MTILKVLAAFVALLVVVFVVGGLILPSSYGLERSVVINAQPEQIHRLVGDLEQWPEWTPWAEQDPTIQTTFGASTTGVGASQTWTGESGDGELTFTMSDPASGIAYDMTIDGKYPAKGGLHYAPSGNGTQVTWKMEGDTVGMVGRWMGLMMPQMVGPMFDQGLSKLKTAAEELPPLEVPVEDVAVEAEAG